MVRTDNCENRHVFPSSKTCYDCGYINQELSLKDREWKCVCGKSIDRDYNASLNILKQGLNMSGSGTKSLNKQKQVESLSLDKAMKLEAHSL
jgi:putative transposase